MQVNKTTWIIFSVKCIHWGLTWPCDNCRLCYFKYFICKSHVRSTRDGRRELFHKSRNMLICHAQNEFCSRFVFSRNAYTGHSSDSSHSSLPCCLLIGQLERRMLGCWPMRRRDIRRWQEARMRSDSRRSHLHTPGQPTQKPAITWSDKHRDHNSQKWSVTSFARKW